MSVYRDFYVMLGYSVDYEIWSNLISKAMDEGDWDLEGELDKWFVADGMSCQYAYFGKTLFHASGYDENEPTVIDTPRNDSMLEVRDKYIEIIGEEPKGIPKLIAFEHYH